MRVAEVVDVDVVADRGAVRRRVVGPEDLDVGIDAERRPEDVRDQMGLGIVVLARAVARAGDVEVAQAHRADLVGGAEVADHVVDRQLRRAVRVRRARRRGLGDRDLVGLAVDRAGRGEDEPLHGRVPHRLEQVQRSADVRAVIALGMLHRFADQRERREVQDRRRSPRSEASRSASASSRSATTSRISRATAARWPRSRLSNTTTSCPAREQLAGDDRADVAGAAGDEELHRAGTIAENRVACR